MKDNFVIMIESFHIGDSGNQHNVSTKLDKYISSYSFDIIFLQIGSWIATR